MQTDSPTPIPTTPPPTQPSNIVLADAQGNVKYDPAQDNVSLTPFADGALWKSAPNPGKPGTFALVDTAGATVAIARNAVVADILCKGAFLFLRAALAEAKRQAPVETQPAN